MKNFFCKFRHLAIFLVISFVSPNQASFSIDVSPEEIYLQNIEDFNNHCVFYTKYFEHRLNLPSGILQSISKVESSLRPWTINVQGKAYYFDNKKDAVKFIAKQQKLGKRSIDVGCMQVNLKHHGNFFANVEAAIDPKTNVAYAAKMLSSKYKSNYKWTEAIAHYHSRHEIPGKKYVSKVMKIWRNKSGEGKPKISNIAQN